MERTPQVRSVAVNDEAALALEKAMQDEYVEMYGEPDQDPDNHISTALEVMVMSLGDEHVGVAAWGVWPDGDGKVKLIYTQPEHRGNGLGALLLGVVEHRMRMEGLTRVRFETGPEQHAAQKMYEAAGYRRTEPFGFYAENEGSHFFVKELR